MSFVTEGRRTVVITGVHVPACLNGPCEKPHLHKGECRYPEGYKTPISRCKPPYAALRRFLDG